MDVCKSIFLISIWEKVKSIKTPCIKCSQPDSDGQAIVLSSMDIVPLHNRIDLYEFKDRGGLSNSSNPYTYLSHQEPPAAL